MEIVRALPDQADALTEIAFAAKRHWGYPDCWIENWRDLLTIRANYLAEQEVYAAIIEGRMVGFYGLLNADRKIRMEHLWILPVAMGRGIGRALFEHGVQRARAAGFSILDIESDPNAEGFYRRVGARRVGVQASVLEGKARELPLLVFELSDP